jgi:lysophospholipase L1-like esterase
MKGSREWVFRLLLLVGGVAAGLLAGELATRGLSPQSVLTIPSDLYVLESSDSYGLRPGFQGIVTNRTEFSHRVSINSVGLRGPELDWTDRARRILALGDSFAFGLGVEAEETFVHQLAERLRAGGIRATALNAGVPGYGIPDSVARFSRLGAQLKPDLVILAVYVGNDLQEAAEPEAAIRGGLIRRGNQARSMGWMDWLYYRSHLYVLLKSALSVGVYEELRAGLGLSKSRRAQRLLREVEIYRTPTGALVERGLAASGRALTRLVELAEERQARLVAVLVPAIVQVDPELWRRSLGMLQLDPESYDVEAPNRLLEELFSAHGVPALDLTQRMRAEQGQNASLYFPADRHWTSAGHRLAAAQLQAFLQENGLLDGL